MTHVDIAADLNSEDETGFVWTYLDEAVEPALIRAGEIVVAGTELTSVACHVVDLIDKPTGTIVHLRVLPGTVAQCRKFVERVGD